MLVNAIEGVVDGGQIRLLEDVSLPENTRVDVIAADARAGITAHIRSPRLVHPEQATDFRKQVLEILPDAKL